jgi:monofunctional biosynthetic peptidoglycan transglycosylase
LRGVAWLVLGLVGAWIVVVLLLTLLYTVVPPVSTLMLGRWLTLQGVERTAVTLDEISPALPRAVIASEDGRYCQHGGVDWDALRQVIEEADEDGPSRGASTISMQLAKNLFLWPGRSYLRKGMEIPLALLIDLAWSKRRLLENYLNIVELGEGVFGAEAAAQRYFGKRARDLSPSEAALLAAALPSPILRNPGRPSARHRALAGRLQRRMELAATATGCLRAALPAGAVLSQRDARR